MKNEAHLPTEQAPTQENTRIPSAHEDHGRPQSAEPPPPRGPQSSLRLSFPKHLKLRKRAEFRLLAKHGRRLVGRAICLDWRHSRYSDTRLGLTVSARYGAAHERNLFKRRIREAFRTSRHLLPPSLDLNIVPRQRAKTASFAQLREELIDLASRAAPPC